MILSRQPTWKLKPDTNVKDSGDRGVQEQKPHTELWSPCRRSCKEKGWTSDVALDHQPPLSPEPQWDPMCLGASWGSGLSESQVPGSLSVGYSLPTGCPPANVSCGHQDSKCTSMDSLQKSLILNAWEMKTRRSPCYSSCTLGTCQCGVYGYKRITSRRPDWVTKWDPDSENQNKPQRRMACMELKETNTNFNRSPWGWEDSFAVKYVTSKHRNVSSIPRTHTKIQVWQTWSPRAWEGGDRDRRIPIV